MKKYIARMSTYDVDAKITEIDVERETGSSVWINGRRHAKRTERECYYDTWDEARDALMKCQENRCMSLRRRLEVANSTLGNVRGMKR